MSARLISIAVALLGSLPALAGQSPDDLTEAFEIVSGPEDDYVNFGSALALHGTTLVVGDHFHSPPGLVTAGAAFVFELQLDGTWTETTELVTPFAKPDAQYGKSVAIHGDTAVVGAPEQDLGILASAGAAVVFERDMGGPNQWGMAAGLLQSDLSGVGSSVNFGAAVAVWGDWVAVGTDPSSFGPLPGGVYLFQRNEGGPGAWGETQKLSSSIPTDRYGSALALEDDVLVVGAPGHPTAPQGVALVYERDGGGNWSEIQQLISSGPVSKEFGTAVGVSGDTIAVGDFGVVSVFQRAVPGTGPFVQVDTILPPGPAGSFGFSLGLSGDRLVVGAKSAGGIVTGEAFLYERNGSFQLSARLLASDGTYKDELGMDVAISGSTAVAGAPNGAAGTTVPHFPFFWDVTHDPVTDTLFASSIALVRLDPSTGVGSYVGGFGLEAPSGLAFDPGTGTLYGVNLPQGLLTIDTATGAATPVGSLGGRNLDSLAFDQTSGLLYSADVNSLDLIRIDPLDASVTVVGNTGKFLVSLSFDAETGELYTSWGQKLYRVDTTSAAVTLAAPMTFTGALADRIGPDLLHNLAPDSLGALSTLTGSSTPLGTPGAPSPEDPGSVYVFELPTIDVTYCTAGSSANGCQALLSATGTASASAASGFSLLATSVEGQKDGLFFFGTNGRQANPWGNGTSYQCVVPPVVRTPTMPGAGTNGLCDGSFALDLNALWCPSCPKPAKNPGTGATVQAQLWYRDPASTSNQTTSLSDAIEFTTAP